MAKDLLAGAKKLGKKAEPKKSSKKDLRVVEIDASLRPQVVELCELAMLESRIEPLLKQRKDAMAGRFFDIWTQEMWDGKSQPDNFNVIINGDSGLADTKCQFQLKFRKDVLKGKLPAEMPEDKTVQEILAEMISKITGMSEKAARKFVDEEVVIEDKTGLVASFDEMYYSADDNPLHKVAVLLLTYLQARPRGKANTVTVEAFSDELANEALVTYQVVTLKEGVDGRIYTYCSSLDELRKLLRFLSVTTQVSNFDYGISDEPAKKAKRLQAAVSRYITADDEE